jgi:hypothetical protein
LHVSVLPPATGDAGEQNDASAPPAVHANPAGSTSVSTTFADAPVPPAVTVTVYLAGSPGAIVASVVFFEIDTSGLHSTATFTGPDVLFTLLASSLDVTAAVFAIVTHCDAVVVAARWIVLLVPWAIVPKLHVRVAPPATGEAGVHAAVSPVSAHVKPDGRVSVSFTLADEPVPPAVTAMLYLAVPPAVILGVVVVFTTATSGLHATAIGIGPDLSLLGSPSFSALTTAVFASAGQWLAAALPVRVMVLLSPAAIVPILQVSVAPPATGDAGVHADASGPVTVQVVPVGNASVSLTPVDSAVPPAVTVMP